MKVKCINTQRLDINSKYQALTAGKEYIVLAIEFYDNLELAACNSWGDFVIYRLKDNDGVVLPYPSKLFEISSNKMPSNWVCFKWGDDFSVLPNLWAREYFWDDYYNDDEVALEEFEKAEKEILAQEQ